VLADPSVAAVARRVGLRSRWTLIGVVKEVRRHDSLEPIFLSQEEGHRHFVVVVALVGENAAVAATVAALVIVVVDKDQGVKSIRKTLYMYVHFYFL
jgi:hypothetical protein